MVMWNYSHTSKPRNNQLINKILVSLGLSAFNEFFGIRISMFRKVATKLEDRKSWKQLSTISLIFRRSYLFYLVLKRKLKLFYLVLKVSFYKIILTLINFHPACNFAIVSLNDDKVFLNLHFLPLFFYLKSWFHRKDDISLKR